MQRIHLISGPRNISTALMYSFAQRQDTVVVDEPFYGHYLASTGVDHPGREEVLASMHTEPEAVVREVIFKEYPRPVVFFKNMAKHLVGFPPNFDLSFLKKLQNVFLIRDPARLIVSFAKVVPEVVESEIGLKHACELFEELSDKGQRPLVLNSDLLLENPPQVLQKLCVALQIPYDEQMLQWQPGPRPEDGCWAPFWYANVHQSSGFQPPPAAPVNFPEAYGALLEEVKPYYEHLNQFAIKPDNYASKIQS